MSTGTRDITGRHRYPVRVRYVVTLFILAIEDLKISLNIKSCIMDIRRAISATHSVRGLSHTKVPWAEVGQVGPQNFVRFFAAERPLPSSPVTRRGPSEKFCCCCISKTLRSHRTCRSGSDISAGLFCHPFCEILHLIKLCKWLVGTKS